jgi:4-hydroxy-tetrahydrodipicolinate reductase
MGRTIADSIEQQPDLKLAGIWMRDGDLDKVVDAADVIIDFSLPGGTVEVLAAVVHHGKPLVCGVSGLDSAQMLLLDQAATQIPVVYDRNMSLGIAVLQRAVRDAAASLGLDFDVEISETHHIHKKDAPSGTALKLGEAIADARGETATGTAHFEVERRGDVPGDHEVVMSSPTERLTFAHSVTTRQVFADGALRAARWVVGQSPGRYRMRDVLLGK